MMDSKAVLKGALVVVKQSLKTRGFAAKGPTFYRKTGDLNTELVEVQKSLASSPAESKVTINYGVYSARIGRKQGDDPTASLDVARAHWRKRLAEAGREKWLFIAPTDSPDEAAHTILVAMDDVLTDLRTHSSDEVLREAWLGGSSPGLTNMQRLLYLALLLQEIGPAGRLAEVVAELQHLVAGTVHEDFIERRLALAGIDARASD